MELLLEVCALPEVLLVEILPCFMGDHVFSLLLEVMAVIMALPPELDVQELIARPDVQDVQDLPGSPV